MYYCTYCDNGIQYKCHCTAVGVSRVDSYKKGGTAVLQYIVGATFLPSVQVCLITSSMFEVLRTIDSLLYEDGVDMVGTSATHCHTANVIPGNNDMYVYFV